jgi:hypothetical protein
MNLRYSRQDFMGIITIVFLVFQAPGHITVFIVTPLDFTILEVTVGVSTLI